MTRWQIYLVLGLSIFGLGLGTGLGWGSHHASAKAVQAQTQADQHEGAAQTHAAQGAASDQQATKDKAAITDSDALAASAKRELDRRLAALHGDAPASHPSVGDSLGSLPEIPDSSTVRTALAQAQIVIADQQQQIAARDRLIASLTASRDQWHAAYDESQKALALQKIAADAAVHSEARRGVRAQLVRGLEGLAIGYVAGRVQR